MRFWTPLVDPDGKDLVGIEGSPGVRMYNKRIGTFIGADFIRMEPGSRFPLHSHEGDHILYVLEGNGYVHIDNKDHAVSAGELIHIPADQAHNVWTGAFPLVFLAVGHPHRAIHSRDRMRIIKEYPADHPVEGDLGSVPL